MPAGIAPHDYQWIRQTVYPVTTCPVAVFLGGSRSGQVTTPVAASDYDVLLVSIYTTKPCSLSLSSPHTGSKYDLILRDYETLAHEVDSARQGGSGTLLHLCAHSQIAEEYNGLGQRLKKNMQGIYARGPLPVTADSVAAEISRGQRDLAWLSGVKQPREFQAGTLVLTHRFGRLALRASRGWVANGKVLGRFLQDRLPQFKAELEAAATVAAPDNVKALEMVLTQRIPALHVDGNPAVPYRPQHEHPVIPGTAEVYHYGRLSRMALHDYLHHTNPATVASAQDWLAFKFNLTAAAVDADRFSRPNREYHYALGRYLNQALEALSLQQPDDPALADGIGRLAAQAPAVLRALPAAVNGQPAALHTAMKDVERIVIPHVRPLQIRPMPAYLRQSPFHIGLL